MGSQMSFEKFSRPRTPCFLLSETVPDFQPSSWMFIIRYLSQVCSIGPGSRQWRNKVSLGSPANIIEDPQNTSQKGRACMEVLQNLRTPCSLLPETVPNFQTLSRMFTIRCSDSRNIFFANKKSFENIIKRNNFQIVRGPNLEKKRVVCSQM